MFKLYKRELEFKIHQNVNGFFYFLRKIPLLKHLAPGSDYKFYGIKDFLMLLSLLTGILQSFFSNVMGMGFFSLFLYGIFVASIGMDGSIVAIILTTTLLIPALTISYAPKDSPDLVNRFYQWFHIEPAKMIRMRLFLGNFIQMVGRALALMVLGRRINITPWEAFAVAFFMYIFEWISTAFYNVLIRKNRWKPNNKLWPFLVNLGIVALFVFIQVRLNVSILSVITSPWMLIFLVIAVFSAVRVWKYEHYTSDFITYVTPIIEDVQSMNSVEAIRKQSALEEKDLRVQSDRYQHLKGYAYLNALFFDRHRRLVLKPLLFKSAVLGGFLVLAVGFFLLFPNHEAIAELQGIWNILPSVIPFVTYFLFHQENMTRHFFINCDQSFLEYGFYRRPKDLLDMFTQRLKTLLRWNLLPATILLVFIGFLAWVTKAPGSTFAPVLIEVIALTVFFSVHTLFIYYIFQPYTVDLKMKNPIYGIINWVVYVLCFTSWQASLSGPAVAPIFISAAVVYSIVALVSVYRFAPKMFKVRA